MNSIEQTKARDAAEPSPPLLTFLTKPGDGVGLLLAFCITMWSCFAMLWIWPDFAIRLLAPVENRELGAIEIVQVVSLIAILSLAVAEAFRPGRRMGHKWLWGAMAAVAAFVFVEEIDYGLHFFDYLTGRPSFTTGFGGTWRNLHNQGGNNDFIKIVVFVPAIILFAIFPLVSRRSVKFGIERRHALFFWFVVLSNVAMRMLFDSDGSPIPESVMQESQATWELVELGLYVLAWTFLAGWVQRNERSNQRG